MTLIEERREHLLQYILLCVRDSALSWQDLTNTTFFDKLLRVLSKDVKIVLKDLSQRGSVGLMQLGMAALAKFSEDVLMKKR